MLIYGIQKTPFKNWQSTVVVPLFIWIVRIYE